MSKKEFAISAQLRTATGKGPAGRMRRERQVPAVVYGHGQAATTLTVSEDGAKLVGRHSGLVTLNLEGRPEPMLAVVREVQRNPLSGRVLHVDFQEVRADEQVVIAVPIEPHGDPAGLSAGGQLERLVHRIDVRCLPADVPELIRVDVRGLQLDQALHVSELQLPEGVTAATDPSQAVFHVRLPRIALVVTEEVAVAAPTEEGAAAEGAEGEPEVIAKGKKPEDGEAPAAGEKAAEKGKEKGKEKGGK